MAGSHFPGSPRATDSQAPRATVAPATQPVAGRPRRFRRALGEQSARRGRARTRSGFWSGSTRVGRAPTGTRGGRRRHRHLPYGPAPHAWDPRGSGRLLTRSATRHSRWPTWSAEEAPMGAVAAHHGHRHGHIGLVDIEVPRERDGPFEPRRVGRWQRPLGGSVTHAEPDACRPAPSKFAANSEVLWAAPRYSRNYSGPASCGTCAELPATMVTSTSMWSNPASSKAPRRPSTRTWEGLPRATMCSTSPRTNTLVTCSP
jgi:hypothetical protein